MNRTPRREAGNDGIQLWRRYDANCDGEFGVDDGAIIQTYISMASHSHLDSNHTPYKLHGVKYVLNMDAIY